MIHKLLHVAIKRRWWLVVPTVVVGLVACAVSTTIPNRYESEAMILVAHQQVPERYVTPNNTTDIREALLLVTDAILSRTQLLQIINEFDLYPKNRKRLAPEDLVELMRSDITISSVEKGSEATKDLNRFTISYTATDPHVAQEVTSRLTTLFIQGDLKSREDQSMGTTAFLDEQLQASAAELKQEESRVRDFRMRYLGQLPDQQQANLGILTGLQGQLQNTMSILSRAREQQVYLESLISQYRSLSPGAVGMPGVPNSSPIDAAKMELTKLKNERADLLARYTDKYPDVVKLDEQIKEAESQLEATAKATEAPKDDAAKVKPSSADSNENSAILAQYKSQLEMNRMEIQNATAEQKQLESRIAEYQSRLNLTPVREAELADMLRDYQISQKNYDDLLSKKTQSELATSLERRQQGQQFRLIDPASLPMKPSSPAHVKIALGGLAAGLALGIGLVFLLETTDHSLVDEKDLSRYFAFPLMVGLPGLATLAEKRKSSLLLKLEWLAMTTLCLLVCASEFYIYRRG
jgi:polysaccharide chain length determinant protein (PEP-CTERM system associated)